MDYVIFWSSWSCLYTELSSRQRSRRPGPWAVHISSRDRRPSLRRPKDQLLRQGRLGVPYGREPLPPTTSPATWGKQVQRVIVSLQGLGVRFLALDGTIDRTPQEKAKMERRRK